MPRLAVLVGGATFFVLGLLSAPSAVLVAASDAFEEERFQNIVNEAPDDIGIDPREFYEQEIFTASHKDDVADVGGGDMAGRRRKLVGIFDATDASSKARAAMERILGGRSESRRKKSLFKKESSKSKDTKKSSKSKDKNDKKESSKSKSSSSKSKSTKKSSSQSNSTKKKSSSSSTDDKSKKKTKESDSNNDADSNSRRKTKKSSSSSKSKSKSNSKSKSDSISSKSKSKKKDSSSKDSKVRYIRDCFKVIYVLNLHSSVLWAIHHLMHSISFAFSEQEG